MPDSKESSIFLPHPSGEPDGVTLPLYFLGICGKGMGAVAAALSRSGWRVEGSDQAAHPPISEYLEANGLVVHSPYAAANLPDGDALHVVGKRVDPDNPELAAILDRGLPFCSLPELLGRMVRRARNLVVTGGAGKTTTTAMLAWILEHNGRNPDYFLGGQARNFDHPARLQGSSLSVLEGDEYASSFDDPDPKFLKYHPDAAIVLNVLEDHPDIYPDAPSLHAAFSKLVRILPRRGILVVPDDDPAAARLAEEAACRVIRTGFSKGADAKVAIVERSPAHTRFQIDGTVFTLAQHGRMNALNAAMAAVAARHYGVTLEASAKALKCFRGVENRQEVVEGGGVACVLDKATHPASIQGLFDALRQRFPNRRLVSFIQPRATGGRRWIYQRDLPAALAMADRCLVWPAYEHRPRPGTEWEGGAFSCSQLVEDTRAQGGSAELLDGNPEALEPKLRRELSHGDILVLTLPEQALELKRRLLDFTAENCKA